MILSSMRVQVWRVCWVDHYYNTTLHLEAKAKIKERFGACVIHYTSCFAHSQTRTNAGNLQPQLSAPRLVADRVLFASSIYCRAFLRPLNSREYQRTHRQRFHWYHSSLRPALPGTRRVSSLQKNRECSAASRTEKRGPTEPRRVATV